MTAIQTFADYRFKDKTRTFKIPPRFKRKLLTLFFKSLGMYDKNNRKLDFRINLTHTHCRTITRKT